jgi:hypothetical protein
MALVASNPSMEDSLPYMSKADLASASMMRFKLTGADLTAVELNQ